MSILEEMFDGTSEPLNERPYSRTQSAIDSAKGKVKGVFGSGQVEQGAKSSGQTANRLWSDFKRYVGKKYGSHPQAVPFADVSAFFKGNNLDVKFLGQNERRSFSPKDVGAALLSAARELENEYPQGGDEQPQKQEQKPQGQDTQSNGSTTPNNSEPVNSPSNGGDLKGKLSSLSSGDRAKLLKLIS